jgi:hypothetical protein
MDMGQSISLSQFLSSVKSPSWFVDLFEERQDVDPLIERRPDAVYLYGVDVMSTKDVLSYFSDYGPTYVEWLNDSACKYVCLNLCAQTL